MSIKPLRKVRDHVDDFLPEDHNDHVDNWRAQLGIDADISSKVGDPPELSDLMARLRSIVNSMVRIQAGEYYYAEHHNKFVDAWELQVEINDLIIRYFPFRERVLTLLALAETLDVKGPPPLALSASPIGVSTEKRVVLGSSVDVVSVGGEAIMPIPVTPSRINIHEVVVPLPLTASRINIHEVVASIGTEVGT
ncbi:MAG: hypothetical protein DRJ67_05135 [Thermoprotei archaeon]|nr:MAG: hypothetical protein DRJ67_05135 [Thermoprotei archaeon]